ncbi:hypothetical protein E4U31_007063 [Claviceps sp. LM219 group G6]|nr:hypothetical protein E4U31_007063 [Claviceps sp. LM219 group G6]
MSIQVQSIVQVFDSIREREETSELRRLVMSRQENPTTVTHVGPSAHFLKPARFSGKDLNIFRAWWASVNSYLDANSNSLSTRQDQDQLGRITPYRHSLRLVYGRSAPL